MDLGERLSGLAREVSWGSGTTVAIASTNSIPQPKSLAGCEQSQGFQYRGKNVS
jgi:hypothetical protein